MPEPVWARWATASEFDEQGRPVVAAWPHGAAALTSLECVAAVYELHFTGARAALPLKERRHTR